MSTVLVFASPTVQAQGSSACGSSGATRVDWSRFGGGSSPQIARDAASRNEVVSAVRAGLSAVPAGLSAVPVGFAWGAISRWSVVAIALAVDGRPRAADFGLARAVGDVSASRSGDLGELDSSRLAMISVPAPGAAVVVFGAESVVGLGAVGRRWGWRDRRGGAGPGGGGKGAGAVGMGVGPVPAGWVEVGPRAKGA